MKNAIVYSFHIKHGKINDLLCYKQLKYSINTLRKFNKNIPVYVNISPLSANTKELGFDKNVHIIKFNLSDDSSWPENWMWSDFLKHRWENAINVMHNHDLDNILYLDTDTIFYEDPEKLFNKYGSTKYLWAKPDNSYDLMSKINVWPGMNDGQFILNKELANKDILDHMKIYINKILYSNRDILTEQEYSDLSWVCTQYAVWDYFESKGNPVKHFDEKEVMVSTEPENNDTSNLILHHYYSSNTYKFLPKEYL